TRRHLVRRSLRHQPQRQPSRPQGQRRHGGHRSARPCFPPPASSPAHYRAALQPVPQSHSLKTVTGWPGGCLSARSASYTGAHVMLIKKMLVAGLLLLMAVSAASAQDEDTLTLCIRGGHVSIVTTTEDCDYALHL